MKSTFLTSTIALVLGSFLLPSSTSAVTIDQCTLSLASLVSDPGLNTCLPMQQLSLLVTSTVTPQLVNDTVTAFCSYPVCSSASITLVENTVTQNCVNASDPNTADLVLEAASLYLPAKEGLCQRVSSTNGTFCVTVFEESLTAYLALNPSPLGIGIFSNETVLKQYVNAMPQDVLCTSCNKAMINPLDNYVSQNQGNLSATVLQWAKVIQTEVQSKCGSDFTNGVTPSTATGSGSGTSAGLISAESSKITVVLGAIFAAGALLL
ncbi:hypothetical protein EDD21DRAFT_382255 [Dissophora ornata]|nr:hypothetical protein EDD21DRAFT_382255 [Dissophora ornata]